MISNNKSKESGSKLKKMTYLTFHIEKIGLKTASQYIDAFIEISLLGKKQT